VFPSEEQKQGWTAAIDGEPVDWAALLAGYEAVVDWPGGSFWPELSAAFPDALVLLSVRPPVDWYRSASNTIFVGIEQTAEGGDPWMQAMVRLFRDRFSDRVGDPDAMMDAFGRHNDAVRSAVPPERLLEWTPGDGWDPICERLALPVPDEPFPITNTTDDFRTMAGMPPLEG
jgi:hypothetical protein